ncbi:DoxX-like family protein [Solibacillus sp. FSL R5-0449]|uniref:DoxX-like family protein n=1 Tax=Solibacillus sp. FSL R5-0449 TaxID=2921639 RepID=UPI0030D59C66
MKKKPIYVETVIDSSIEKVWQYTQQPDLHEQWDLRFTSITYNEKQHEDAPQTFTYTTKIMPGLSVAGWGESKGTHEKASGVKTSSLHFGTPQMISPIKEGRGYWQYIPNGDRVTFLTQYDYDARFGRFGQLFDLLFRPVIGWATALSFNVLARWIELGEKPATQYRRFFSYYLLCFLFSFIWLYQGLVPKVLMKHPLEIDMLMKLSPLAYGQASTAIVWIGMLEMVIGIIFLVPKLQPLLLKAQILLFPLLTLSAIIAAPSVATAPFNVVTFNVGLWIASIVALLLTKELPTAKFCKRKRGA